MRTPHDHHALLQLGSKTSIATKIFQREELLFVGKSKSALGVVEARLCGALFLHRHFCIGGDGGQLVVSLV